MADFRPVSVILNYFTKISKLLQNEIDIFFMWPLNLINWLTFRDSVLNFKKYHVPEVTESG